MHEDLIKRLRAVEKMLTTANFSEASSLISQAADAIDELTRENESLAKSVNEASEILRRRWIPVTERLPEDGSLVGKLIADSDGCIRIASQCAVITLSGGKTVYTDLIDLVSFLAKDTPTTEWEDCTHITHWMPLPEPPKEESNGV